MKIHLWKSGVNIGSRRCEENQNGAQLCEPQQSTSCNTLQFSSRAFGPAKLLRVTDPRSARWQADLHARAIPENPPRDPVGYQCRDSRERAFTLIEIMVVVVILGILAATIIPQFMGTTHDAKVSTAKSNIAEIESALERFNIHMDRHPTTEEGLKALVEAPSGEEEKWRGPYIKLLRNDPWGSPYQYRNPGARRESGFDLWSRGADKADAGEGEAADLGNW